MRWPQGPGQGLAGREVGVAEVALEAGAVGRLGVRTAAALGAQHVGKGRFGHPAILPDGKAPAIPAPPAPGEGGAAGCEADYDGGCFVMTLARMPDILTLTMNPALDISTAIDRVEPVHKLRCGPHQTHPGGGGIRRWRVCCTVWGAA